MDGVHFESRVREVVGGQVRGVKQRRQKQAEGGRGLSRCLWSLRGFSPDCPVGSDSPAMRCRGMSNVCQAA